MANLINLGRRVSDRMHSALRTRRLTAAFQRGVADVGGASAFERLHPMSLAISTVKPTDRSSAHLNVVLPELRPRAIFAGIRTALEVACELSRQAKIPLRLITLGNNPTAGDRRAITHYLAREFGYSQPLVILGAGRLVGFPVGDSDLWVGTHWTTAHSLDIACRLGVVEARRVVYLIQDYEPGFHPWSTNFALARSTYHAGFHPVVNSTPLRQFLTDSEGVLVDDRSVFGPSLDLGRIRLAAESRLKSPTPRIFFYGRPSKPRNLFDIGVAALSLVAQDLELRGINATFISAGESHASIQLAESHTLESRGKLPWEEYFSLLGQSDVVLSLQHSPHPSHPPLDAVSSGAFAVTNELNGTRAGLHDHLLVAEPEPGALSRQVLQAIDRAMSGGTGAFDGAFSKHFGGSIPETVQHVLGKVRAVTGGPRAEALSSNNVDGDEA